MKTSESSHRQIPSRKTLIVAPFPSHTSSALHNRKRTDTAFRLMASPLAAMSSNSNLSKDLFPPSLLKDRLQMLLVPSRKWNLKWEEFATPIPPDWLPPGMIFQRRQICRCKWI
ncbi:hypothetical protein CEXT_90251 [Caerostris extrusa]|uniref:Uncharacterized protein n=1 Tax=Caerostris extrusa TaxID=172846 RepID=A0AAV4WYC4_CAEEX|nr:hypothetical protein CEXT_90251 [Caerostris extrusa]